MTNTGPGWVETTQPAVLPVARVGLVPATAAVSVRLAADVGLQHHRARVALVQAGGQLGFRGRCRPLAAAVARRNQAVVDRDPDRRARHDVARPQPVSKLPEIGCLRGQGQEQPAVQGRDVTVDLLLTPSYHNMLNAGIPVNIRNTV